MAKTAPKTAPETPETEAVDLPGSPVDGESRSNMHTRIIPKIIESCSYDMDSGAIFGRVMARLQANGATDDEIGEKVGEIRKAVDAHVADRTAKAERRAESKAARDQIAIGKALGD